MQKSTDLSGRPEAGMQGGRVALADPHAPAASVLKQDFFNLVPVASALIDAQGRISAVNPQWCTETGWEIAELQGKNLADLLAAADRLRLAAAMAELAGGVASTTLELAVQTREAGMITKHITLAQPSSASQGLILIMTAGAAAQSHVSSAKTTRREKLLSRILDNTVAMIGILEPDGTLVEANMPALTSASLARSDVIGKKFWDCYWWCHDPVEVERLRAAVTTAAAGQVQRYDAVVRVANESTITIDFMLSPVRDDHGEVCMLIPSGFDISERKRSEQRLAYAMREVNHRSKNLLTVVQSMLRQMRPDNLADFVDGFGQRLRALSACQDLIVQSFSDRLSLKDLILSQFGPFESVLLERVRLHGDDQEISADLAQSLGMAFYELVTNASKYGALSNSTGEIDISWGVIDAAGQADAMFFLSWQESNGPKVETPTRRGFGSVVLKDMLALAFNGSSDIEYSPAGLHWRLHIPMSVFASFPDEPDQASRLRNLA